MLQCFFCGVFWKLFLGEKKKSKLKISEMMNYFTGNWSKLNGNNTNANKTFFEQLILDIYNKQLKAIKECSLLPVALFWWNLLHGELMHVHVLLRDFISVWISNICFFLTSVLTKIPALNTQHTFWVIGVP